MEIGWSGQEIGWDPFESKEATFDSIEELDGLESEFFYGLK
jgi:hypothetical protein